MPIVATLPSFMRHKSESAFCQCEVAAAAGSGGGGGGRGPGTGVRERVHGERRGRVTAAKTRKIKNGGKICKHPSEKRVRVFFRLLFARFTLHICVVLVHFPVGKWKATAKTDKQKK